MKFGQFSKPARLKLLCALAVFLASVWSVVLTSAQAGQGNASFQVALKIVARSPAPRVSEQVIFATTSGDPPHLMLKGQVMSEGQPGHRVLVITTEY
ncbi:MAG: hypothetical protein ABI135_09490 [Rhodoferax sp.]